MVLYAPTPPPGLPNALGDIVSKIRRITKSPSQNQITDDQIVQYINTYFLYDFPQELRLKNCLSNYTFATIPFQESYRLPTDTIITVEPPVYIAGYESFFTQSQDNFYRLYPRLSLQYRGPSGNGTVGPYPITLSPPAGVQMEGVLQNNVVLSVLDSNGLATAIATDTPINTTIGNITGQGIAAAPTSTINYVTGVITVYFSSVVPTTDTIWVQYVPYVASRPTAMLFYQDTIYLRPIPDASYLVNIQAFINPIAAITGASFNPPIGQTYTPAIGAGTNDPVAPMPPNVNPIARGFVSDTDTAQVKQWWQLIAWGAALKIFEDRGDIDNISKFMPLYDNQRRLVLRRTLVEQANERAQTIYTDQTSHGGNNWFNQF